MNYYCISALQVAVTLFFIIGCSSGYPPQGTQTGPAGELPGVVYADPSPRTSYDDPVRAVDDSYPGLKRVIASNHLLDSIKLTDPKIGHKGIFSRAQVTIENLTQQRYELEYQYQWEDQDGFAVGTPRPWNRFALGPKEFRNIHEMALDQAAKQAVFTVRLVDDSELKEETSPQPYQSNQTWVSPDTTN